MAGLITAATLRVPALPSDCVSIDVCFDGRRIWSIDVRDLNTQQEFELFWPPSLQSHLRGVVNLIVADSTTGEAFLEEEVRFSQHDGRATVLDENGRELVVNKWGDLAPSLETAFPGVQERLLQQSKRLVLELTELGLRPFIVGGTLLGAVRDQKLLPHDDDADLAYLSEYTDPVDVAIEGFRIGHRLEALGYELVRHSAAHMQLIFRSKDGAIDFHIDIFAAFFTEDGYINQPFHVRGKLAPQQMLPFSSVTIDGNTFPAPADPEAWLVINYDEHWRTPMPGFQIVTPEATVRRFYNWFGGFNINREYWDHWHTVEKARATQRATSQSEEWLVEQPLPSRTCVEIGCGSGDLAARLQRLDPSKRVIAVDYSEVALDRARAAHSGKGLVFLHANLNRMLSLAIPTEADIDGPFDLIADHMLEQITPRARENLLRLARLALRSGGVAIATGFGRPADRIRKDDPTTWHLEKQDLRHEAAALGMVTKFYSFTNAIDGLRRAPYGVSFHLGTPKTIRVSPRRRVRNLARKIRRSAREIADAHAREIRELQDDIQALQQEVDEYRRNSLRVAEIIDMLEQQLARPTQPRTE